MSNIFVEIFKVFDGAKSGVEDVGHAIGDIASGNVHGAVTDIRKVFGDTGDVLTGLAGLGMDLGRMPKWFEHSWLGKLSDSPILAGAQQVIRAEKMLTGSGEPEDGAGYSDSAKRLASAVETLVDANRARDRWDGPAADAYQEANDKHRRLTSKVQAMDENIGNILRTEADQINRTRKTLDDASQDLYDYGLSTAWMNATVATRVMKQALDLAAATAALATTTATMDVMVKDAAENALRVRGCAHNYADAARDKSGENNSCGPFVPPQEDKTHLPSRLTLPKYSPPAPEHPHSGPPATPYGSPGQPPPVPPTSPATTLPGAAAPPGSPLARPSAFPPSGSENQTFSAPAAPSSPAPSTSPTPAAPPIAGLSAAPVMSAGAASAPPVAASSGAVTPADPSSGPRSFAAAAPRPAAAAPSAADPADEARPIGSPLPAPVDARTHSGGDLASAQPTTSTDTPKDTPLTRTRL